MKGRGGTMKQRGHNYAFDILRILACFLVIVNHTNSEVFLGMNPSLTWALSLAYFYFSKIAGTNLFDDFRSAAAAQRVQLQGAADS